MELLTASIHFLLHLDQHLQLAAQHYGAWIYLLLFLIVFCETGLVITPFLPGDSLLFIAGAVAANGILYAPGLFALLVVAAFGGDNTNYWIGRHLGPRVFRYPKSRLFNPLYLNRTHDFYERHGGKTVLFARFLPVLRTFAPFVAGIARMRYSEFLLYSLGGSVFWIGGFLFAGYYFGAIPIIRQHLTVLTGAIILLSLLPAVIEFARQKLHA